MEIKMLRNSFISGKIVLKGEVYPVQESDGKLLIAMKKAVAIIAGGDEETDEETDTPKGKGKGKKKKGKNGN